MIHADVVVMCAGSWLGRIDAGQPVAPDVRPIRGQVLLLRPRVPITARILWGPRCYLVPRADGCLLVGATVEDVGFDESTTVAGLRGCRRDRSVAGLATRRGLVARRSAAGDALRLPSSAPGLAGVSTPGAYRNGALLARSRRDPGRHYPEGRRSR